MLGLLVILAGCWAWWRILSLKRLAERQRRELAAMRMNLTAGDRVKVVRRSGRDVSGEVVYAGVDVVQVFTEDGILEQVHKSSIYPLCLN